MTRGLIADRREVARRKAVRARFDAVRERLPTRALAAGSSLTLANGLFQVGNFIAVVLVARSLGRSDFGTFAVASGIGFFVVGGAGSGLPVLALRETAAGHVDGVFVRKVCRVELGVTLAATGAATVLGAAVLGGWYGALLGALAGLANVVLTQFSLLCAIHTGLRRFGTVVAAQTLCGGAIALLTAAALVLRTGLVGSLLALGIAGVLFVPPLRRGLHGTVAENAAADVTSLFRRSRSFVGMGILYGGYQRIDSLVVLAVTTPATAGLYAAAYRVLGAFSLLAKGFGTVFFTYLSALHGGPGWDRFRRRGARLFLLGMLPPAVLAFALMPWLIEQVFGPSYSGAVTPARILLLSLVPFILYFPNAHALNACGREAVFFRVLLASLVLETALVAFLSSRLGANGAALSWLLTEVFVLAGVSADFHRQERQSRATS